MLEIIIKLAKIDERKKTILLFMFGGKSLENIHLRLEDNVQKKIWIINEMDDILM